MTAQSCSYADAPRETGVAAMHADILAPLVNAPADRPFVIGQLGQSLDGRIATPTGDSRWINRGCALDHLHRLRASVDAVVVGVGTVIADDPQLTVRRVQGRHPARAVIDPNGRMPRSARVLEVDGARRLAFVADAALCTAGAEPVVIQRRDAQFCPHEIIAALFARGFRKILIEGGAATVSSFLDAGALDRLHVLVAPVIIGSGKTGLSLTAIRGLDEARRPLTRVYPLADGDVIFDCDLRQAI